MFSVYPNPFEQQIQIQFELPASDEHVTVDIYDAYGISIARIFEGATESGQLHKFTLNTSKLRGGIFVARLMTSSGKHYYVKLMRTE